MGSVALNLMIGSLFLLFFYQLYKGRNPGGSSKGTGAAGKNAKNSASKDDKGGWFKG